MAVVRGQAQPEWERYKTMIQVRLQLMIILATDYSDD